MGHGAGIWLAAVVAFGGCDVAVLRGLPAAEAREVADRLERRGVVARVVPEAGGARLEVNQAAVAEAVGVITRGVEGGCEAQVERSWLETPGEERARAEARLERQLGQSIARLPGVAQARVHVTLAAGMRAVPESQTSAAASVLLVRAQAGKSVETEVRELVAGAVPGLSPAAVRVVETREEPAAAELRFARVGPIVVRQESAGLLQGWIAGALMVQLLLAAAVLRPLLRRRRND